MTPRTCHGNEISGFTHARNCRPGRPLCRARRKIREKRRPCGCDAYHFPHRKGSGACGDVELRWARVYGMTKEEVHRLNQECSSCAAE